ncbi:uncharacterized protein LOC143246594 isoform X2 [Tachypleus tridentatus]
MASAGNVKLPRYETKNTSLQSQKHEAHMETSAQPHTLLNKEPGKDAFCWVCHRDKISVNCQMCARGYHLQCIPNRQQSDSWVCPECCTIMVAEETDTRSLALNLLTISEFCVLLKYVVQRIKGIALQPFLHPVSHQEFPDYYQYIVHPMDLSILEKKVKEKGYGCTESFIADTKWLVHNSIIYNGPQHPLSANAKSIVKQVKREVSEIEVCPDCYSHCCSLKDDWFIEPCRISHTLIYAKLKGYPFWPAKAVRVLNGFIDARFFGAHDRAWIPIDKCYLVSKDPPTPLKKKNMALQRSVEELQAHLVRLQKKNIPFSYAPYKTVVDPDKIVTLSKSSEKDESFDKKKSHLIKQGKMEVKEEGNGVVQTSTRSNSSEKNSSKKRGCPKRYLEQSKKIIVSKKLKEDPHPSHETVSLTENDSNKNYTSIRNEQNSSLTENGTSSVTKIENKQNQRTSGGLHSGGDDELAEDKLVIDEDHNSEANTKEVVSSQGELKGDKTEVKSSNVHCTQLQLDDKRPEEIKVQENSNGAVRNVCASSLAGKTIQRQDRLVNVTKVKQNYRKQPVLDGINTKVDMGKSETFSSSQGATEILHIGTRSQSSVVSEGTTWDEGKILEVLGKKESDIPSSELKSLLDKAGQVDSLTKRVSFLEQEIQKLRWLHDQEVVEMKHNHKLTLLEVRSSWEHEQKTCVENLNKIHAMEKEREIEATKKKQWCANCSKEAHFYCCWNTSYCNHSCQQAHWPIHVNTCSQTRESFTTSFSDTST